MLPMAKTEKNLTRLQYEANCHEYRADVSMVSLLSSLILSTANVVGNHPVLKTAVDIVYYSSLAEVVLSTRGFLRKTVKINKRQETTGEPIPDVSARHFFTRKNLYRNPSISSSA